MEDLLLLIRRQSKPRKPREIKPEDRIGQGNGNYLKGADHFSYTAEAVRGQAGARCFFCRFK
ncbi:hypothetical protein MARPO_3714s0002 [Marchantia polymorpha]|uniref:Uncharacterized protein n=1 Tax=Marchantia polymorpha TaxID=3197 RepID=A0A2R6VXD7_MARPO|nr:hypothetical protein MARPO_3714s0002 [Marchantia polymorpha]|eukprot:PTQ26267.1 hypothetical protein MARPO_3714s0002 [Marchantia polymorpha]